ncbi:MAG: GFA family protein [Xanthobacteraceae bacterium]
MRLPLTGGCQCGRVRYEIGAKPLSLYACHCTECQRQSGSAFGLSLAVARDAMVVVSGTPAVWRRVLAGGRAIECLFCADCGTRLFHNPERNLQASIVKPGTLDDATWLEPVGHIWTGSAQPWVQIPHDTVNYEGQPPDLSRLIEAWQARQAKE